MKTYLLDTINRIKQYSATLDAQTNLSGKSWVVFNDSGDKEVLIFNADGTVLITVNGVGIKRTWQWIAANKSLIISQPDDSIVMLHPEYLDNSVMALNRDGTNEYAFLIDENNSSNFAPKTLSELKAYFDDIERKPIEDKRRAEAEKAENAEKKRHQAMLQKVRDKFEISELGCILGFVLVPIFFVGGALLLATNNMELGCILLFVTIIFSIFAYYLGVVEPKNKAKRFLEEHPHDELAKYIREYYHL